jgi:hypothetical protein
MLNCCRSNWRDRPRRVSRGRFHHDRAERRPVSIRERRSRNVGQCGRRQAKKRSVSVREELTLLTAGPTPGQLIESVIEARGPIFSSHKVYHGRREAEAVGRYSRPDRRKCLNLINPAQSCCTRGRPRVGRIRTPPRMNSTPAASKAAMIASIVRR